MKRGLSLLGAALLFTGCGVNDGADAFRRGTTKSDMVKLNLPASATGGSNARAGSGGLGQSRDALAGEKAFSYTLTRGVTVAVNGWTVAVLDLVKRITEQRPSSVTKDTAVWGPGGDALSPNIYKLTVHKTGDHVYTYALDAKAKSEQSEAAWVTVLSGTHTVSTDDAGAEQERFGHGDFTVDFDAAKTLPENDGNTGKIAFVYGKDAEAAKATVDVSFESFHDHADAAGKTTSAQYHYDATPGAGGNFGFHTQGNLDSDPARPGVEDLTIQSRWLETGAGRSDLNAEGGDLAEPAQVSECWDTAFASRFLSVSYDASQNYGSAETDCAQGLSAAEFPNG